jgi:hypothetical protein
MIAITPCTSSDSPAIAALWNTMAGIEESCWRQAPTVTAQDIDALVASGVTFVLAADAGEPLGFAFWQPAGNALLLEAIAAQTADVYYRLMIAYADWGLERELAQGACEIGARQTREMGWMNALDVVQTQPIGRDPAVQGQEPQQRATQRLRVTANLPALRQAALDELGG